MTDSLVVLVGVASAFTTTLLVTPAVSRWARAHSWTDDPDGLRKLHARPTPTIGGVAIVLGIAVGLLTMAMLGGPTLSSLSESAIVLVGGGVVISLIGFADDVGKLDFRWRLLGETVVGIAVVVMGGLQFDVFEPEHVVLSVIEAGVSVIWVVLLTNSVNIIDGIDGLASGVAAISIAGIGAIFYSTGLYGPVLICLVFIFSILAFLIYNNNPASIFMGDTGSLFLGYVLSVFSLYAASERGAGIGMVAVLLVVGYPILDVVLSVVRRLAKKASIYRADRDHIHHRMVNRMSVRKAVLVIYAVSGLLSLLAFVASRSSLTGGSVTVGVAAAVAIVLLVRLGYVRMPYSPPHLETFPASQEGGRQDDTDPPSAYDTPALPSTQEIA